jgi:acyl-CoA synthetase (AMP-forming)/AMP-acid ligase II
VTIDRLLLRCVPYTPEKTAVVTLHNRYSYRDLSCAVVSCANYLSDKGVVRGDRLVAVLDPGFDAVVLLCACFQLGIIVVPVSPENANGRIQSIVDAVSPAAFVSAERPETAAGRYRTATEVSLGTIHEGTLIWSAHRGYGRTVQQLHQVLDLDPAYIGPSFDATGELQGIVMSHGSACVFFEALLTFSALPIGTIVGSIAPIQFDFWLLNVAAALGSGGTIAFVPRDSCFRPKEMAWHIQELGINQMNCVPSIWTSLLRHAEAEVQQIPTLSCIFCAREPLPLDDLSRLQRLCPELRIITCFGQPESIACSLAEVANPLPEGLETLSFGRGLPGVEILLLDGHGREVVTPGVAGEIYLRSPSLFLGYWDDPAATARAKVPHPFHPQTGERVFKTGDLAFFDESGDYFFAGRTGNDGKASDSLNFSRIARLKGA